MNEGQIVPDISDSRKAGVLSSSIAFFSNDLTRLKNLLFTQLFANDDPTLLRKLIIIPTDMIKNYLIQSFNEEGGLLFQVRFLTLPQLIQHLTKLSLPPSTKPRFPSHYTLSLHIEYEIRKILGDQNDEAVDLIHYIQGSEKKLLSISREMSHVYLHYGLYGASALIDWERERGWQQLLWRRLKTFWDFPCQLIPSALDIPFKMEIHFFAPSQIPLLYRNYFDRLESKLPIYYYCKSPTPLYWGDSLSEKKRARTDGLWQQKGISIDERVQFHELTSDTNPLVANLSQMAMPLFNHLMEKESVEDYEIEEGKTLLSKLQEEIFSLTPPSTSYVMDDSIVLNEAPTKMREIEILLHNLKKIYKTKPFTEDEVLVLAPNIDDYAPYIEWIFGSDPLLGYEITNVSTPKLQSTLTAIRLFFSLVDSRFEPKDLFRLLLAPPFLEKTPFTIEDVEYLESVVEEMGINWGFDLKERQEILNNDEILDHGSWSLGFGVLIQELAFLSSTIPLSKAALLGDFIAFVETLHTNLRHLRKKRPLVEWIGLLQDLILYYFTFDDEAKYFLTEIARLNDLSVAIDSPYSYPSMRGILNEIFQGQTRNCRSQNGQQIRFTSFSEGVLPPVKILCLIGLDEDAFPRRKTHRSINELKKRKGCDHQVEMPEKDRYSFLEALVTPKDSLLISYVSMHETDNKILHPSLLVRELFHYFKCNFTTKNPPFSFAKSIVQKDYFSKRDYKLAKAYYEPQAIENIAHTTTPKIVKEINVANLFKLAKHPIQFFCNQSLGIYYKKENEEETRNSREFVLSYLDRARLVNQALLEEEGDVLKKAKETNLLPTALFRETAAFEVLETINSMKLHLSTLKLDNTPFFSLHLLPSCNSAAEHHNKTITKAIHLKDEDSEYTLYGKIDFITKSGLYVNGEEDFKEAWKYYPHLLILKIALPSIPSVLLFGKSGSSREFHIPDPTKALLSYIHYYKQALITTSPLMPDRVESYLKGDIERFTKLCQTTSTLFKDPYLEALKPDTKFPWKDYLGEACSALIV